MFEDYLVVSDEEFMNDICFIGLYCNKVKNIKKFC